MTKEKFEMVVPNDQRLPFGCRLQTNPNKQIILPHWHDTYEIDYVVNSQNQNFYLDGKTFNQKKGEIVCVNPYQIHGLTLPKDENRVAITLMIPLALLDKLNINKLDFRIQNRIFEPSNQRYLFLVSLFDELTRILRCADDTFLRTEKIGLVYAILGILFKDFSKPDKLVFDNFANNRLDYIKQSLEWLGDNYMYQIRIDDLAKQVKLSNSYFSHLFKQITGQTPQTYLTGIRLAHARQIIQNTDLTMTQIALKTGFSNVKAMNTAFKKNFGMTPYQYKLEQQKAGFDIF
ncbi:AraC family transcriptional regulator [Companilactobacillus sp. HBUAS59544]|uniref:AraC family transcriptional regulator n=1 Tax=Companilactobacillus sp. HBUAS59544 TaxID=3109363 RepID=UPI002FF41BC2